MFEPGNKLETLMQAAVGDPAKIPDFYRTLLESEIFILTPDTAVPRGSKRSLAFKERLNIATVDYQGLKWHPAFTARTRISAYLKEPETCLAAKARDLFEMLPGSNFWFNPLSECQKPLPADEVLLLLNGKIFEMNLGAAAVSGSR